MAYLTWGVVLVGYLAVVGLLAVVQVAVESSLTDHELRLTGRTRPRADDDCEDE